jgi:hypothetical protein
LAEDERYLQALAPLSERSGQFYQQDGNVTQPSLLNGTLMTGLLL